MFYTFGGEAILSFSFKSWSIVWIICCDLLCKTVNVGCKHNVEFCFDTVHIMKKEKVKSINVDYVLGGIL